MSKPAGPSQRQPALLRSFGHALAGMAVLLRTQRNARIHLGITAAVGLAGAVWRISAAEWLAIVGMVGLVLAAEAFNSALEALVDLVSPGRHPLAGQAKDLAAAAVLIAAASAVATGAVIFLPRMLALLP